MQFHMTLAYVRYSLRGKYFEDFIDGCVHAYSISDIYSRIYMSIKFYLILIISFIYSN